MNSKYDEKLIYSTDARVVYPTNDEDDAFFDGIRIPRVKGGRISGILRVDQTDEEDGTPIQLRNLFFVWNKEMPAFFLLAEGEGEHAGTKLRFWGGDLQIGKTYTISPNNDADIDAMFERPSVIVYPHLSLVGSLTVRSIDSVSIGGSFRFFTENRRPDDQRKINFFCLNFDIKLDG